MSHSDLVPLDEALAYSPKDAARVTGLGVTTIYKLLGNGTLKSRHLGSRRLISAASLRSFIEGEAA